MSSEPSARAHEVLDKVFVLLDEARLSREIDDPIDAAFSLFSHSEEPIQGQRQLDEFLVRFVQHMYATGVRFKRKLLPCEALAEAKAFLRHSYANRGADGYDAALLGTIRDDSLAVERIPVCLVEALKERERSIYRRWVHAREVEALDWTLKCELVAVCLAHDDDWLAEELPVSDCGQLADCLPDMIDLLLLGR